MTRHGASAEKRAANDEMRGRFDDVFRRRGKSDTAMPFFCECDRAACYRTVWLFGDQYDRLRADPRWRAICPDHAGAPFDAA